MWYRCRGCIRIERLIDERIRLTRRQCSLRPKGLSLVHAMVAGGSHIDHADLLHSGATQQVLPHRVRRAPGPRRPSMPHLRKRGVAPRIDRAG